MTHHLVGTVEIAKMLGVSRQRAHQIGEKASFPEPAAHLASGKVWETAAVEAWIAEHRPELQPNPTVEPGPSDQAGG